MDCPVSYREGRVTAEAVKAIPYDRPFDGGMAPAEAAPMIIDKHSEARFHATDLGVIPHTRLVAISARRMLP
jgi:hypothetical protein